MDNNIKLNGTSFSYSELLVHAKSGKESFYNFFKERVWTEYNEAAQLRFIDELWSMSSKEDEVVEKQPKSKSK
jgi:hypothetical protein